VSDYYIDVIRFEDNKVMESKGPFTKRQAERIDDGMNINLNRDIYYTITREVICND
jgi:hypothetical protein